MIRPSPTPAPLAAAGRHLLVCCDGTNNTLTGGHNDTHVLQLVQLLASQPSEQRQVFYDAGVGVPDKSPPTDLADWVRRGWERLSGLATGRGVFDNIAEAYLFLVRQWRGPQDRIYLFGFSRGAFTARAVAGMVNLFGIVRPEHENLVPMLIRVYFSAAATDTGRLQRFWSMLMGRDARERYAHARADIAEQVRQTFATAEGRTAWVEWVGVWDTVESVGMLGKTNPAVASVADKRFRHVRHALALDEHRRPFRPRLYEEPADLDIAATGQTLRQRWFAGVHCDVGGSYAPQDSGLADDALRWMLDELSAVAPDLQLPRLPARHNRRLRHDPLHDAPWWALAGMVLRDLQPRMRHRGLQPIAVVAAPGLAPPQGSVWQRRRSMWPVLLALLAGAWCLWRSGLAVPPAVPDAASCAGTAALWTEAGRACSLAHQQLASLWHGGWLAGGWHGIAELGQLPGRSLARAMVWDLGFIAAWGYLLARIASRAFAWLAGARHPGDGLPGWRWLGLAPMVAVLGDVAEDALLLLALGLASIGQPVLGAIALWLGGVAGLAKWVGLVASVPLVAVRLWIALRGGPARQPA